MNTAAAQAPELHKTEPPAGPASGSVISARGLVKRYSGLDAVGGIDLDVRHGEIFAFLGPNGAGKTTTVEILAGFREPTRGRVAVLGVDPAHAGRAWRDRVGVVLQESQPEPGLTVRQCLLLYAGYYQAPRDIDETIALAGLAGKTGTLCEHLSGGQRRRLDVALALVGDPELIFLDEPTTGFDPSARRAAWDVVAGLRALGKTVFLTTHFMDEAEHLADRIAVINAGRIVAEGTPRTLGGRDRMAATIRFTLPGGLGLADLPSGLRPLAVAVPGQPGWTVPGQRASAAPARPAEPVWMAPARPAGPACGHEVILQSESPLIHVQMLAGWALGHGFDLPDLDIRRPTLEEVYLSLTNADKDQS